MLTLLEQRKSIRDFLPKTIEKEKQKQILQAALRAPTAGNMSLYSILVVEDQEIKNKLVDSCDHQPFIAKAPLVLLFVADHSRWYKLFKEKDPRCKKPGMGDLFLSACDALIAAQSAAICGEALGLGSCYVGDILENAEFHRELFQLPPYTMPITLLCLGYPTELQKKRPQPPRFQREAMVFSNHYQDKSLEELREDLRKKDPKRGAQAQIDDLYKRKWTSSFLLEMERSVALWLKWWEEA